MRQTFEAQASGNLSVAGGGRCELAGITA